MTAPNIIHDEVLVGLVGEVVRKVEQDLTSGTLSEQPGLYSGEAGSVLYLLCLYLSVHDDALLPVIKQKLEFITNRVNDGDVGWSFANGLGGILWLIRKCEKYGVCSIRDEDISYYEQALLEQGKEYLQAGNVDLLHGAFGFFWSVLCRERKNGRSQIVAETEILLKDHVFPVIENKISSAAGQVEDLSLAHGLTGNLLFLCKIAGLHLLKQETSRLIALLARKILHFEFKSEKPSLFPGRLDQEHRDLPSRLAWCYGDLGIAHAFLWASFVLNDRTWRDHAIRIFLHAAQRRTPEETGISATGFCHGRMGVAYLFLKGYQETGNPELQKACLFWIQQSLEMLKQTKDLSLLEGKAGIGLTLLAATGPVIPDWDECFFLS
ncbi:MAG: hypothetical protein FJY10_02155 [Bacteroidetes bacterium]|nr:hypothetical protein [Bacteroidota bacterium]